MAGQIKFIMIVKAISASYGNKTHRAEENPSDFSGIRYGWIPHLGRNANFTVYLSFEPELAFKSLRKACSL
jgi:hypothetical protein